ncbi:MAG: 16S rRNA (cytosine(1402)-N(4))-methyltransferase, partial [Lachnospiraceae bacterium]|nr:16S rRNA (cytosine(1402)-N(4))-methyltransferase [Lachnospiraceae bacterium]
QALRIECNGELDVLKDSIDGFADSLKPGGRLCIITFHSLEDRIVKEAFRRYENPCICPPQFPVCTCGRKPIGRAVTRKPLTAGPDELKNNPRASSAKLRIFEKTQ